MTSEDLIRAAMESDEAFIKEFHRIIKDELHSTAADFSEKSGIPASTIYKLLSGQREPNIKTLRQIIAQCFAKLKEQKNMISSQLSQPARSLIISSKKN